MVRTRSGRHASRQGYVGGVFIRSCQECSNTFNDDNNLIAQRNADRFKKHLSTWLRLRCAFKMTQPQATPGVMHMTLRGHKAPSPSFTFAVLPAGMKRADAELLRQQVVVDTRQIKVSPSPIFSLAETMSRVSAVQDLASMLMGHDLATLGTYPLV